MITLAAKTQKNVVIIKNPPKKMKKGLTLFLEWCILIAGRGTRAALLESPL